MWLARLPEDDWTRAVARIPRARPRTGEVREREARRAPWDSWAGEQGVTGDEKR